MTYSTFHSLFSHRLFATYPIGVKIEIGQQNFILNRTLSVLKVVIEHYSLCIGFRSRFGQDVGPTLGI
jgi:hypothetical protein